MIANFDKKGNRDFFNNDFLFKMVGIIFIIIIIILIISDFKIYQKKRELNSEIISYQKQISDIEKRSQTLKNEIANSNSVDYLEKLGYEQFDQTRPGETEYMFINPVKKTAVTPVKKSFWDIKSWSVWWVNKFNWIKSKF